MRSDGRSSTQLRPMRFTPNFSKHPKGSVLVESGDTIVLCSVNVEDSVPGWLRHQRPSRGWLTAEYSMLPSATHQRTKRERFHVNGRTQEIQRLIGRSLRGIVDLGKCPDMTFVIDCDVIQADGGTRTAAINGACVALHLAVNKLLREGRLKQNPIRESVAAVSVGIKGESYLVDLDYSEDSTAATDMSLVMTQSNRILEIQGTGEQAGFVAADVNKILEIAEESMQSIFELQQVACDGQEAVS